MYLAAVSTARISLIMVAALTWLVCALYAAGTARNNGASYHLWLVVGLMTGPLGLVVALIYFRVTGERYRRHRYSVDGRSDLPEMVRCPGCGQTVPHSYMTCHFCGTSLKGTGRGRR